MKMRIGKYEILEEIGQGGFATVYKARHNTLQKVVAVKVLKPVQMADAKNYERFIREARSASSLDHPHIVRIEKLIEEQDQISIAMDYYPSGDLRKFASERGPLSSKDMIRILGQVADALDYAHERGIIHRDVKPTNILMDEKGNAFLTDFGLVRQVGDIHLTQIGSMVGTATYTSPEQAQGKNDLNGNTDQYSLAVIAYELLVGKVPFLGDDSTAVALLHVTAKPPIPSDINPEINNEVDQIILKALDKEPGRRFTTCAEFVKSLDNAIQSGKMRHFRELLDQSRALLAECKFEEVKEKLELAHSTLPDQSDMQSMLLEIEQTRQNAQVYEQCCQSWKDAEQKARRVLDQYPKYQDPQGVFVTLNLRPQRLTWPFNREQLIQLGIGFIVGCSAAAIIFFSMFQIITG